MEPRVRHIAVGAFTLILLIAAAAILLWTAADSVDGETRPYRVLFRGDATGLSVGVGVRYQGLPVGRVVGVGFAPDAPNVVQARVAIRADAPISADTTAQLTTAGLTGGAFIQLSGGGPSSPPIPPAADGGPPIIEARDGGLTALMAEAPALAASAGRVLNNLDALTGGENQAAAAATMRDFAAAAAAFRAVALQADDSVDAAGSAAREIGALAGDLRLLVGELGALIERVDAQTALIAESAATTLASADDAARAVAGAAGEAEAFVAAVRPPAARFAETGLYEAGQLAAEMRVLVGTLNRLADRLERDPGAFLFGDGQGGFEMR